MESSWNHKLTVPLSMVLLLILILSVATSYIVVSETSKAENESIELVHSQTLAYIQLNIINTELAYLSSLDEGQIYSRDTVTGIRQRIASLLNAIDVIDRHSTNLSHDTNVHSPIPLTDYLTKIRINAMQLAKHISIPNGAAQVTEFVQQTTNTRQVIEGALPLLLEQIQVQKSEVQHSLLLVRLFVLGQSVLSLLVVYILARALKAYIRSMTRTKRLSRFTENTPNAIFCLTTDDQIFYKNPACGELLSRLQVSASTLIDHIASSLQSSQVLLEKSNKKSTSFYTIIRDVSLRCDVHFADEEQQWDIHLTDETNRIKAENQLKYQAYHHPSSGLSNQRKFRAQLSDRAQNQDAFILGMIEVRSFSEILQRTGFLEAQDVVKHIANIINDTCADQLFDADVYHIGDKDFAVIIDKTCNVPIIESLVSHINAALRDAPELIEFRPQLDFGFACFPHDASSIEAVINVARIALDTSASNQHSAFKVFDKALGAKISRQQKIIEALTLQVGSPSMNLFYQPQLDTTSGNIVGFEALLRWQFEGEWISPAEFIPIAEKSGRIIELGTWVLHRACEEGALLRHHNPELSLAVNISPSQFHHPDFLDTLNDVLNTTTYPAHYLELEITEGMLMSDKQEVAQKLSTLKAMGVKLSIDDFGTGYSSLSYLKALPIDKLKIDRSFIANLLSNQADQSIVSAIINLAENLGMNLIAEGTETKGQVDWLNKRGCRQVQGFWLSEALTLDNAIAFMAEERSHQHI
ncbi:EAL domain-containing protein [Aestuariibacter sp. AA17]|uniref:EAL domain-containing protein n=1 Tax=Fluctibacter corallii TaxID=2984329 RepID=A0ABT3AA73_9ALTE|nr:GGDEF domain-containing phosphodiesterase [Aestuariibacter sp. AA17]MCV2885576.1 EAL domain-containing protein [Aestuariibacter sp. AA17]